MSKNLEPMRLVIPSGNFLKFNDCLNRTTILPISEIAEISERAYLFGTYNEFVNLIRMKDGTKYGTNENPEDLFRRI